MNVIEENEKLLKEWEAASLKNNEVAEFVPDGILYRGDIKYSEQGCWGHEPGNEMEIWQNAPKRILYITKDLNDEEGWDIRCETGRKNYSGEEHIRIHKGTNFCPNYMYQVYGLGHTTVEHCVEKDSFSDEDAIAYFDTCALARINCKKQLGKGSLDDNVLTEYINKYSDFLKRQILLLDADIIVCCGWTQKGGNKIWDFVNTHCYEFTKVNDWISYNQSLNKIVINSWHPSMWRISVKDFYQQMIEAYHDFLKQYPDFLKPNR